MAHRSGRDRLFLLQVNDSLDLSAVSELITIARIALRWSGTAVRSQICLHLPLDQGSRPHAPSFSCGLSEDARDPLAFKAGSKRPGRAA